MFASNQSSFARRSVRQARRRSGKPTFEMLEQRQHFSVYTVNSTADIATPASSPQHTLVDAINISNASKDYTIDFNIPKTDPGYSASTGVWTISASSDLPAITRPVIVDGDSQPGYTNSPLIEINAQPHSNTQNGLLVEAGGTTIRGLAVENFAYDINILAGADECTIVGNAVSDSIGNGLVGIMVRSNQNIIGAPGQGNTATNVFGDGIDIFGSNNDVAGNNCNNNAYDGIDLFGSYNTVRFNSLHANPWAGVEVESGNVDEAILGNSISIPILQISYGLGIRLDNGANSGVSAPIIRSATGNTSFISVNGLGESLANSTVRIEFFASPGGDARQGQTYLGEETVATGASGGYSFSQDLIGSYVGESITATATVTRSLGAETSEFSDSVTPSFLIPIVHLPLPVIDP
jgi:parallel beta-helix repeat protein